MLVIWCAVLVVNPGQTLLAWMVLDSIVILFTIYLMIVHNTKKPLPVCGHRWSGFIQISQSFICACVFVVASGVCDAGFWCISGAASATPSDGVTGTPCTVGHYCLSGTSLPAPCPLGTWSNSTRLSSPEQCQPCPGGYYCNDTGLTEPSGSCAPRFLIYLFSSTVVSPVTSSL